MIDPRVERWLSELASPNEETRVEAARWLADVAELPPHAAPLLARTLSDGASISVEHSDWDGTVVGGTTFFARDHAATALKKLGEPAIEALLAVDGHESLLVEVVVAAGPDRLARLPAELRDRVRQRLQGHWSADRAGWALEWAETAPGDEAIVRAHPDLHAVVEACERLAAKPDATRAVVALERFGRENLPREWDERVGKALAKLAPLADDEALTRFAVQVAARADFYVMTVVCNLGSRVAGAGPKLLERMLGAGNDQGVVARAVGLVLGAPRSADDARVARFLTVQEKVRGVMEPPHQVLDTLILSCGGGENLAPWVLAPLIARLKEPDFDRRVDASKRLRALRKHAAPAGAALEAALREEIRGPRAKWRGTSDLAWSLSLAGEAAARAVPLFIEMLELPEAASAGLHALNGQSELFAEAIPALEKYLARATDTSLRDEIERTLKRVRYLSEEQAQTKR